MISKEAFRLIVTATAAKTGMSQEEMALDMGYGKNYISDILSPSGKVSAKFIKAFQSHFNDGSENTKNTAGAQNDLSSLIRSNADLAESNKALAHSHSELVTMLKEKERDISSDVQRFELTQEEILALLKAAIQVDLDYKSGGNQKKADEMAAKINTSAAEIFQTFSKRDKRVAGKIGK